MKQIHVVGDRKICHTTFVTEEGDIKIVRRNQLGQQQSVIKRADPDAIKQSGFIKLYVVDKKDQETEAYFNWCNLFEATYPDLALPRALQEARKIMSRAGEFKDEPTVQLPLL